MSVEDNYKRARKLNTRLVKVSNNIDDIIGIVATTSETTNIYWQNLQSQIDKAYTQLRVITKDWLNANLPVVYNESIRVEIARIKNKKHAVLKQDIKYRVFKNKDINKQTLSTLFGESLSSFDTGYISGQKTITRLLKVTQQLNIQDKQINQSIEKGYIDKGSAWGSIKRLQKNLLKKSIDGKYITVVDKNGKPIRYQVKTYAEMVARTKLIEASSLAVINTAQAVGSDLVQWSAHNTTCSVCAPYEGKIYSISGDSNRFPRLDVTPPAHPRCLHSLTTAFEEAMKIDGTLEKFTDFSNGTSMVHPTRKSHIPVNKRKLE